MREYINSLLEHKTLKAFLTCTPHSVPLSESKPPGPSDMKIAALFLLGLASFQVEATPLKPRASAQSWEFVLYQNARCTGAQDVYSGNGTSPCRHDIRHGSALGIIRERISPGCAITLFEGQNCTQPVQNITSRTPETCMHPEEFSSFNVHCFARK